MMGGAMLSTLIRQELNEDLESSLNDTGWIAREFGVADVSGDSPREIASDLVYQLGWEEGHGGRKHGRVKDLLGLAKKNRWHDVAKSYAAGLADGRSGASEGDISTQLSAALVEGSSALRWFSKSTDPNGHPGYRPKKKPLRDRFFVRRCPGGWCVDDLEKEDSARFLAMDECAVWIEQVSGESVE